MAGTYDKGDLVRLSAAFTDLAGALINPTTVTVKWKNPGGSVITKTYDTDTEVVQDSTGNYHIDVDADEAGSWWYRWESTGTGQAAAEAPFQVERSQF